MNALTRVKNHSYVSFVQNLLSRNSSARTTPAPVLKDLNHNKFIYVIPYFAGLINIDIIIVTPSTIRNPITKMRTKTGFFCAESISVLAKKMQDKTILVF